jgi:hypothetical protein
MRVVMVFLFLVTAGLCFLVTVGGWSRLSGGAPICIFYVLMYLLFAFLVTRWNRGVLPVSAALGIVLAIFCALATPTWFDRAKDGFSSPLFPEELLGLLTLLIVFVQIIVIGAALIAFNQEWQVEEERPIGGIVPPDEGHEPPPDLPDDQPAPA